MSNGRCRLHGGKSLGGVASPRFKHGRHSKFRAVRLLDDMDAAMDAVEKLSMRDEIALVSTWINDAIQQLESHERPGNTSEHPAAWRRVEDLIGMRQRLIRTEILQLTAMGAAVPIPVVQALVAALYDSLRRHVTDPVVLSAIHRDITALLTYQPKDQGPIAV